MPSDTLFYRLFNPGIPLGVFLAVLSLSVLTSCIIMCKRQREKNKLGLMVWIVAYILLMLYSTVLGREAGSSVSIHLTPFWSIGAIQEGYIETLYEKIYNVIFFVPYGFLLGAIQEASPKSSPESLTPSPSPEGKGDRKAYPQPRKIGEWISGIRELGKKKKSLPNPLLKERESIREGKGGQLGIVVLIGCLTSVIIELLQLITRTGMCETDDVICNTLGCAVGAGMTIGISGIRELWNEGIRKRGNSGTREGKGSKLRRRDA